MKINIWMSLGAEGGTPAVFFFGGGELEAGPVVCF